MDGRSIDVVFQHLDAIASARTPTVPSSRRHDRRSLRVRCSICFLAFDGSHVATAFGVTRDISRSGLGLLTTQALPEDIEVKVSLILTPDQLVDMTGIVVQARLVRVGWYLVGVQFGAIHDRRLVHPDEINGSAEAELDDALAKSEPDVPDEKHSARRMLTPSGTARRTPDTARR